jgi:hypothetical protein
LILKAIKEADETSPIQERIELQEVKAFFPKKEKTGLGESRIVERTLKNMTRSNRLLAKFGINLIGNSKEPVFLMKNKQLLKVVGDVENEK